MNTITPQDLRAWLTDGGELALFDLREQGVYCKSHLLFAVCLPLSHLEARVGRLAPRRSVRMVLCDDGEGLAGRGHEALEALGYSDISILKGGITAWARAGFELFSGVNVPSKAFGEFIEHEDDTPRIEAGDLQRMIDAGENLVILDSRPYGEYHRMNIPGGIDTPGAELVHRVHDLAPDPARTVVVNCAGRTRSIIGAQSLINAGIPNRVVALKDGTMGWELAGLDLEQGATRRAPDPSPDAREIAQARAAAVAKRFGIAHIDEAALARWQAETNERSLFLLDVRSPEEFAAGHRPGSRSAPGGQLVQGTDEYVGVRNARLVLVDDTAVRATMTASWLVQMGWPEVAVLDNGLAGDLETGAGTGAALPLVTPIDAQTLNEALEAGDCCVVDFATSLQYRAGHIPGAAFAVRARLPEDAAKLPPAERYVATSPDGVHARYTAADLAAATGKPVQVLDGGTKAWRDAGYPLAQGFEHLASTNDDVWYKPYDHDDGDDPEKHMRAYLEWEVDLVRQIARDGTANFRRFPAGA
ncbi:MAG TPA: rhodanese-like domain-containing protein [Alphaproteobacteria bacterium]|nr:rhodanese-like domain-containing protein [Alphaproteobacteria bacterium]